MKNDIGASSPLVLDWRAIFVCVFIDERDSFTVRLDCSCSSSCFKRTTSASWTTAMFFTRIIYSNYTTSVSKSAMRNSNECSIESSPNRMFITYRLNRSTVDSTNLSIHRTRPLHEDKGTQRWTNRFSLSLLLYLTFSSSLYQASIYIFLRCTARSNAVEE